jgi:hypothetical protein
MKFIDRPFHDPKRPRRQNTLRVYLAGLIATLVLSVGAVVADETDAPAVDPKAEEVLRETARYLSQAKSIGFAFQESFDEIDETGLRMQYSNTRRVGLRRPDKLAAQSQGDTIDREFRYNGRKAALFDRRHNAYALLEEAPETVEGLLAYLTNRFGFVVPLEDLLYADLYESVMSRADRVAYLGIHNVGEFKCHHLALAQDVVDWQIWIEAGTTPIPRKVVINYKQEPGNPGYQALITDWRVDVELPDALFEFSPPAGARQIEIAPVDETSEQ